MLNSAGSHVRGIVGECHDHYRSLPVALLIRNGRVWQDDVFREADILIRDGRIAAVGTLEQQYDAEVLDARNLTVLPGFIDIHTHIDDRIGRYTLADDCASGTQCAVRNGITTLGTFVTESADLPLGDAFAAMAGRACGRTYCHLFCHITPVRYDEESWRVIEELLSRGVRTVKLYTTYRQAGLYADYDQIERIFSALRHCTVRFLVHCEDDMLLDRAADEISDWSAPIAHAHARPSGAEVAAIRAVLDRAAAQEAPVHIVHVSTPEGADLIADAKPEVDVTCETAPHYLMLDSRQMEGRDGHRWICSPPLRSAAVREELARRALEGAFDLFATDHCAFRRSDKDAGRADCRTVPGGIAGIGALPHLIYHLFADAGKDGMTALARHLAENPARVAGLYPQKGTLNVGADADLVIASAGAARRPVRSSLADTYEPYEEFTSSLSIHHVVLQGKPVVENGQLLAIDHPRGRCIWET